MENKAKREIKPNFIMVLLMAVITMGLIAQTIVFARPAFAAKKNKIDTVVFFGDDAGVGLEVASGGDETKTWYCERGKGLTWLKKQFDEAKDINSSKNIAIVVAAGFNECSNTLKAKKYVKFLNKKAKEFNKDNKVPLYYVNVTPVDEHKYGTALNKKVEAWNEYMLNNLNETIVYVDAYSLVNENLQTKNDGYHLTEDEYRVIYEDIIHKLGLKTAEEIAQKALNKKNKKKAVKAVNGWGYDKHGEPVYYDGDQKIVKGWKVIEGGKYYFDKYGHSLKGLQEIKGKTYFFNTIGLMSKGLVEVEEGKYSLFGDDGARLDKWQEYAGNKYYISKDGFCLVGWWSIGTRTYYFKEDCAVATGLTNIDGKTYYFDEDGGVRVGWQNIDGKKYYFEDGGSMAVGKYELNGQYYYFFEDGGIAVGWNTENDGVRYYTSDGIMMTGFQMIDGEGYFFADGGLMETGWYEFSDGKRIFDSTGKMIRGLYSGVDGTYYFDPETGFMQTGWVKIDGSNTYFGDDGKIGTGWQKINGKNYLLDKNGHVTANMVKISKKVYFFNKSGAVVFSIPVWAIAVFILFLILRVVTRYIKKHTNLKEGIIDAMRNPSEDESESASDVRGTSSSDEYDDDDEEVIEDD